MPLFVNHRQLSRATYSRQDTVPFISKHMLSAAAAATAPEVVNRSAGHRRTEFEVWTVSVGACRGAPAAGHVTYVTSWETSRASRAELKKISRYFQILQLVFCWCSMPVCWS